MNKLYADPLQSHSSKPFRLGPIKTSKREIIDIAKGWGALSFAFALIYSGIHLLGGRSFTNIISLEFLILFLVSLFTAGLGFLLHELAHKFVAQHYGCAAEFRAFDQMLYMAVGLAAVIGFIFAAPGAVMIVGNVTRRENGIISAAGPLTNYVLAGLFFGISSLGGFWSIFSVGFFINIWLGLFNMIPFGNFDGRKIYQWNMPVWIAMVAFGIALMVVL
ncbi:metalloprotease [archaeon]|nr:metalloprotease [archaeon]MBT6698225.1 metalloprotease [archaeon]